MEKNWIEEIKEFIRKAMNKGFKVDQRHYHSIENDPYTFIINDSITIHIDIVCKYITISTPKGCFNKNNISLTKRDLLELDALVLSIEEYREDMAISEFNNFFGDEENKEITINDLDNEDD